MTFIPDTRNDDYYNEDFLDKTSKACLVGYDFAIDEIITLIAGNLDIYEDELTELCPEDHEIEEDDAFSKREDLLEILEDNKEVICAVIKDWMERNRDELVTSMIDGMDDTEYETLKAEAIKSGKEYYDTRHYAITGEKIDRNKQS